MPADTRSDPPSRKRKTLPVLNTVGEVYVWAATNIDALRLDLSLMEIMSDREILDSMLDDPDPVVQMKALEISAHFADIKDPETQKQALRSAAISLRNLAQKETNSRSGDEYLLSTARNYLRLLRDGREMTPALEENLSKILRLLDARVDGGL